MNESNLLKKLAPVGVAAFSAVSIIGITSTKVQAATAYAYSEANFDVDITTTGFTIPGFFTETADSAELRFPEMSDGNADFTDADQACVDNTGTGPIACKVIDNTFLGTFLDSAGLAVTDGPVGQLNADYARSDVIITSASTSDVEGINAAETFVDDLDKTVGDADAEWEYGTEQFTAEEGDILTIDLLGYYDLIIELENNGDFEGFAESEYEFGIFLDGVNLLAFASENDLVENADNTGQFQANTGFFGLLPPPDIFQFSEAISRTNLEGREGLSQELDCNSQVDGAQSCSFDIVFGFGDGQIAPGTYDLTIESLEEVTARAEADTVPEPASIIGLLTVSGLGLALKRKKRL